MAQRQRKRSIETTHTPDEIMCVCLARQIRNGDAVALGLATPLSAAAAILARRTHAPEIYIASTIGVTVTRQPPTLSLRQAEGEWLDSGLFHVGFAKAATELLPAARPKEFFRPGQVDRRGNFNNVAFGSQYERPRLRMPGVAGIADVSVFMDEMCLYVPRHSRIVFPHEIDYRSGLGHSAERRRGSGPRYLVSDLGQFDYADGIMRLTHLHPGIELDRVRAKTAFELATASKVGTTDPPTAAELGMLRTEIDPLGIRKLEMLSGPQRRRALREIIRRDSGDG